MIDFLKKILGGFDAQLSKELWHIPSQEETYFSLFSFQIRISHTGGACGFQLTILGLCVIYTNPWLSDYLKNKLEKVCVNDQV